MARAARFHRRGVGAVGVAADGGGTYPLGGDFVVLGTHLNGLSTGSAVSPFSSSHSKVVITRVNVTSGRSGRDRPPGDPWQAGNAISEGK